GQYAVSFFIYIIIKTKTTAIHNHILNNTPPIHFILTFLYSSTKTTKSPQQPYQKKPFFHPSFITTFTTHDLTT
ncbi:hypothetical protein, partial [Bacillus pumilus]|uniref:hypothetical protein n=1 Tax=Bacillus pumilus TaxID=1408 RepID=UPI001C9318F3